MSRPQHDGHDLGGVTAQGAINPEPEASEPVFHAEWERRVFALTLATGMLGKWSIDESRFARERQDAKDYLNNSYYENWLFGLETLLNEKALLGAKAGTNSLPVPDAPAAKKILASGGPSLREDVAPPRFQLGQSVRVSKPQHGGHTRVPAYVDDAIGQVSSHYGTHVYPDASARGEQQAEHLYSIVFAGSTLWGADAQTAEVYVDLWQPYLEAVE